MNLTMKEIRLTFQNSQKKWLIKRAIKKLEQLQANSIFIQELKDGIKGD